MAKNVTGAVWQVEEYELSGMFVNICMYVGWFTVYRLWEKWRSGGVARHETASEAVALNI